MRPWLTRGIVMAVIYAAAEALLASVQVNHPNSGSILDPITLAILVGVSGTWAGVDGWLRKPRRGMAWFYAGLVGGVLAGLLSVIARALFVDQTGVWALWPALTGDAAFIALLIMVPAGLGIAVGGRLEPPDRRPSPLPRAQGRRAPRSAEPGR